MSPVDELPVGTVTFLFTDIEGSTALIEELGEKSYVGALGEHRRLLREAFGGQGGVEVDTQGDAFLYAFAEPGAEERPAGRLSGRPASSLVQRFVVVASLGSRTDVLRAVFAVGVAAVATVWSLRL